jgi:hypothetical protein
MAEINVTSDVIRRGGAMSVPGIHADTLLVAAAVSALSLLHTGFVFGIENNLFHLPIVAGLYNEPQYQDDSFIQSLRYFASGIWTVLSDTQRYFGRIDLLFLVLTYLSRLLCFVGFLCCASLVGIVERRDKIIFGLIVCFTSFLDGESHAGMGGLFQRYFSHSEVANGTLLLAIYFAARGRFTAAAVALGATFFINAFIAVWLAPLLMLIAISLLSKRQTTVGAVCWRTAAGIVLCIPFALPVLHAVLSNPDFGKPIAFDFVAFLRQYYPGHVLIDAIPTGEIVALAGVVLVGAAALWRLGAPASELRAAYVGAALVYLAGIVLPYVTGSPLLLNLHLLRSSTIVHLLAGLAAAALAVNWLRSDRAASFLPACLIVLALSLDGRAFWFAVPIMLMPGTFRAAPESAPAYARPLGYLVLASAVLIVWPYTTWQNFRFNALFADAVGEWMDVGRWARTSTPPTAIFLVPPRPRDDAVPAPTVPDIALSRTGVFEFASHRRVWIDFKRGAAVMWTPAYYQTWRSRMSETDGLSSRAERVAYASRHGIAYVVDLCREPPTDGDAVFRTRRLCVFRAGS